VGGDIATPSVLVDATVSPTKKGKKRKRRRERLKNLNSCGEEERSSAAFDKRQFFLQKKGEKERGRAALERRVGRISSRGGGKGVKPKITFLAPGGKYRKIGLISSTSPALHLSGGEKGFLNSLQKE